MRKSTVSGLKKWKSILHNSKLWYFYQQGPWTLEQTVLIASMFAVLTSLNFYLPSLTVKQLDIAL